MSDEDDQSLAAQVANIATSYFGRARVPLSDVGEVIESIAQTLSALDARPEEAPPEKRLTRAQIRKSVTAGSLISFEDGRSYKVLRRHLAAKGLSANEYREKWGLPSDYPMVAPSYSAIRSKLAKDIGLGMKGRSARKGKAVSEGAAKGQKKARK